MEVFKSYSKGKNELKVFIKTFKSYEFSEK